MVNKLSFEEFKNEVLKDYRIAVLSRKLSVHGRKEVLNGKAKFGIFGDGKEVAQIALAKTFNKGDWRSGYYRDQTWMLAKGMLTPLEFFAQLYGDNSLENNPTHGGRLMNNHFGSRNLDNNGNHIKHTNQYNSVTDISPTAGQMPRSIGLAYASKLYRQNNDLHHLTSFSNLGNEVTFTSIGDASTSEGHFWEALNASGVLQIPLAVSVWDDGWGISVPKELQTVKQSISKALKGFEKNESEKGILIYTAKGWDYPRLCKIYSEGIEKCRKNHIPVLFHIEEMTQPTGHSTSGSHERYKSKEQIKKEKEFDPILKMSEWIIKKNIATQEQLTELQITIEEEVIEAKNQALTRAFLPVIKDTSDFFSIIDKLPQHHKNLPQIAKHCDALKKKKFPLLSDVERALYNSIIYFTANDIKEKEFRKELLELYSKLKQKNNRIFNSHLYSESEKNPINIPHTPLKYAPDTKTCPGREILRNNFHALFKKYPELVTFGEDTGKIGGVNQSLQGLQEEFGSLRITDTGIREATIIGQGIGLSIRGLRPIAEIQYFDYLMYGLQIINDDLACLHYRTVGGQKAPLIIRTRGHRLEGVWHSGSFLGIVVNAMRGIYICVPRNMTQAAGFYNTLIQGDNPSLVIEPLNAYRVHEPSPENYGEYTVPLGVPDILVEGTDVTIVTYGSCVKIVEQAINKLYAFDISVELIDVQTLIPFDIHHSIAKSVHKTGKLLFVDEDVPGGTTAYMMQQVLEKQEIAEHLQIPAKTLTAKEHRPAYGNDGDFFSKPNEIDIFHATYQLMHTYDNTMYPQIYK